MNKYGFDNKVDSCLMTRQRNLTLNVSVFGNVLGKKLFIVKPLNPGLPLKALLY